MAGKCKFSLVVYFETLQMLCQKHYTSVDTAKVSHLTCDFVGPSSIITKAVDTVTNIKVPRSQRNISDDRIP
jgi:hypothetical protein